MLGLHELVDGAFARITGRVRVLDTQTIEAPFSGRRCVYYAVATVFIGGRGTQVLASHQNGAPFFLEDEERRAVIELAHAQLSISFRHRTRTPAMHTRADRTEGGYTERREAVIVAGDRLVVAGTAVSEPDPEQMPTQLYRGTTPQRFRFSGTKDDPLLISDEPSLFPTE